MGNPRTFNFAADLSFVVFMVPSGSVLCSCVLSLIHFYIVEVLRAQVESDSSRSDCNFYAPKRFFEHLG